VRSPAWLQAYDAGQMPPVSELNDAFVRPAFPEQVVLAYYQGSLVSDHTPQVIGDFAGGRIGRTYSHGWIRGAIAAVNKEG